MNGKMLAAILGIALLSGCTSTKTSPERHAYYFVSHKSNFVGGNFTSSVPQNYRLNVPQFRELYAQGKADRSAGRTAAEASEYAQSIRDQLRKEASTDHAFSGNASDKWTSEMEDKDAILFGNELAATYLDGYNGVQ
ncbi:Exc2 family lipoprotein [Enterobacter oligotrophicus]|uniref:Exc2 family lipoprotein n=1 Tax=Enterobacter oligotrophicus TaxID=2478464 RepID=UPI0012609607|nr:Exc2 family lipoprotein [Enterobacter oligotrophicus]